MPNLTINTLGLLNDFEGNFAFQNLCMMWMYTEPLALLWAEKVFVPAHLIKKDLDFEIPMEPGPQRDCMMQCMRHAWATLIDEHIIEAPCVDDATAEAYVTTATAVRNRLTQTREGRLASIGAPAQVVDDDGPFELRIGNDLFCINQLDSLAANLVLAKATQSVLHCDDRAQQFIRWLFAGGLDPATVSLNAQNAVAASLDALPIPAPRLFPIPPFGPLDECRKKGTACCIVRDGVKAWVEDSRRAIEWTLAIRDTPEVKSLRRLMHTTSQALCDCGVTEFADMKRAANAELSAAAFTARKRMQVISPSLYRMVDIGMYFSLPLAVFASNTESSLLGLLSGVLAGGAHVLSGATKYLLLERHRWLGIESIVRT